jgi:ketosteroid isomerase-like protein
MKTVRSAVAGLLALAWFALAPAWAESQLDAEIRQMERAEAEALLKGNLAALDKLWADGYVASLPAAGVRSRDEIARAIKAETLRYTTLERQPEYIADQGETVVVMGREKVVTLGADRTPGNPVMRRYMNVWIKRDGRWQLAATQAVVSPS